MTERNGDWLQTYTGRQYWPCDPRPEDVSLLDIAHALAHQCRFGGHSRRFYSVAQHCVIVSQICDEADAKWGLMHDAAEAYLVDLPRPVKKHSLLGANYEIIERRNMQVICSRFGLPEDEPPSVKIADNVALVTEMRDLMFRPPIPWRESFLYTPLPERIVPWSPDLAERAFFARFRHLFGAEKAIEGGAPCVQSN